jgi:hypothetical protein
MKSSHYKNSSALRSKYAGEWPILPLKIHQKNRQKQSFGGFHEGSLI